MIEAMKYGIVVYHETKNIGDDIQSYAAAQLLPQVDYYIERERMDVFRPDEEEPVNVIMNGWFMYNKLAWPVSPCINPLYISMHFWQEDPLEIRAGFLEGLGGEDLRRHEPVGCRDRATQKMLEQAGIKTWHSACLTLTLQAKFPKTDEHCIYLVDVSDETVEFVKQRYPDESIRIVHQEEEGLVNPEASWKERFANVEKLLTMYQNAKAVVTTRLHCAMPCLGLGTPVLFLYQSGIPEQDRFDGLNVLVHHASETDFLAGKTDFDLANPGSNPDTYLAYRQKLIERVQQFVEDNRVCTPELKQRYLSYDKDWERRAVWKNSQIVRLEKLAIRRWDEDHQWMDQQEESRRWLTEKNRELEAALSEKEKELETQRAWSEEQEKAKEWLSAKNSELEAALSEKEKELEAQRAWSEEQEKAKEWLSAKVSELEAALSEKEKELEAQRAWSEEQEKAKEWLSAKNDELEGMLRGRENELEQSRACVKWLEAKNEGQKKRLEQLMRAQE